VGAGKGKAGQRFAATFALALVAAVSATAAPAGANPTSCAPYAPPGASPRIVHTTLDGLDLNVLLPADYATDTSRRYPVLLLLHGADYNENTWVTQTDLAAFTEPFTGDRGVIVVMPDGGPLGGYRDSFDGRQQWETYHLDRVIPWVDDNFRTIADRSHRAVAGFSYGGYGAMHYAARHPDLFAIAGSFSGIVHATVPEDPYAGAPAAQPAPGAGNPKPPRAARPDPQFAPPNDTDSGCGGNGSANGDRVNDAIDWHNHNPADLASNLRGLTLYVASGNGTPCPDDVGAEPSGLSAAEPAFRDMGDAFDMALTRDDIAHTTVRTPCGIHNLKSSERHLHAFWPLMEQAFGTATAPKSFDHRSADPDFGVYGWSFRADEARAAEFLEVRGAGRGGVTLTGSGTETVVTAPLFKPGARVAVAGAAPSSAVADGNGRLTIAVDLGPAHTTEQFDPGAPAPDFVTRAVTFKPAGKTPAPQPASFPARRACRPHARLTIRLRAPRRLRAVSVRVNGRRVYRRTGRRIRRAIRLMNLPRRAFAVRVTVRTKRGRLVTSRHRYRAC
jgi:S-formylglutathione hydrolase FrmB